MPKFLLLALVLSLPAAAKSPVVGKKSSLLAQLHQACVKNSFAEGKSQEPVCDCLRANYEKRLSDGELEMLARIQAGTAGKEEMAKADEVFEFDLLASQQCLENTQWRWEREKETGEVPAQTVRKDKPKAKAKPEKKPGAQPQP